MYKHIMNIGTHRLLLFSIALSYILHVLFLIPIAIVHVTLCLIYSLIIPYDLLILDISLRHRVLSELHLTPCIFHLLITL